MTSFARIYVALMGFFIHICIHCYSVAGINKNFLPYNLHLQPNEICFINDFESFIPAIVLNTFAFRSSVLFETYILENCNFQDICQN